MKYLSIFLVVVTLTCCTQSAKNSEERPSFVFDHCVELIRPILNRQISTVKPFISEFHSLEELKEISEIQLLNPRDSDSLFVIYLLEIPVGTSDSILVRSVPFIYFEQKSDLLTMRGMYAGGEYFYDGSSDASRYVQNDPPYDTLNYTNLFDRVYERLFNNLIEQNNDQRQYKMLIINFPNKPNVQLIKKLVLDFATTKDKIIRNVCTTNLEDVQKTSLLEAILKMPIKVTYDSLAVKW